MSIQRTLSIIKPDAVIKNVIGQIVARFEQAGLKVIAARLQQLSRADAERFYAVHKERPFFKDLVDFMVSGPVFVQVLEGEEAIQKNRDLMGATDPKKAARAPSAPISPTASTPTPCTAPTLRKRPLSKSPSSSPKSTSTAVDSRGNAVIVFSFARSWNPSNESICWGLMAPPCPNSSGNGGKPFRARQLQRWMHQRGADSFDAMTDLAREFRGQLAERCRIEALPVNTEQRSSDGTRKWLFDVGQGNAIETVFIPEDDRGTLCISSQAGCVVNCRFCSTGHQGFNRNLKTSEIIGQLWWAKRVLEANIGTARLESAKASEDTRVVSNVVMMGMGEPLLNYDQVLPALRLMLDDNAYGLSRRRVTVSTSGVVPMMDRLSQDCPVALAVSLHAPNDALRDELVPLNKKYPLKELLAACERYLAHAPRDFITFEYCMLDGINDTDQHAKNDPACTTGALQAQPDPVQPFPRVGPEALAFGACESLRAAPDGRGHRHDGAQDTGRRH